VTVALLGIDCATDPRKTGLTLGELGDGVVTISRCTICAKKHPPAALASEWLDRCDSVLIALDAPLGWPRALGARLQSHRAGAVLGREANELFRRATDDEIYGRLGKRMLDVGADRIARTAVAALELLDCLRREAGRPIPLAWAPNGDATWRAIEVYPAATRIAHGAADHGGSLEGLGDLLDCSTVEPAVLASKDAVDACVCALAAADFLLGRAVAPPHLETALVEGWIWAPAPPAQRS
jgi:predicted nuclease with RNAse H fold